MKTSFKEPYLLILGLIFLGIVLLSFSKSQKCDYEAFTYHNLNELIALNDFPTDSNTLFVGSGNCILCHGDPTQFPNSSANLDSLGNDVSPVSTWSAAMMANSAKDPFWRAKVQHEGILNPNFQDNIETLCTTCHAPLGHFDAFHNGLTSYTIDDLENDALGLDGVSCNACHMMEDNDLGITFSGDITYNENHIEYGQYSDPFQNPMINHTGFTPEQGLHISSAQACGKCHSLITETISDDGELTENSFVEQAVYHEWLNSNFSEEGRSCISCHMKKLDETIKLTPMPPWLDGREQFSKHDIVGGNVFMLGLIKNNASDLDVNASDNQFDDIISLTTSMLQDSAISLEVNVASIEEDSAIIELVLTNRTGHKLPSGYPSRKMMIEFTLTSATGDTIFRSGGFNENGRIIGEVDNTFESHYDVITEEDQVQLYEYVMGDEDDVMTTVLTRAYSGLKDNRIPPVGFTTEHFAYDTVQIIGAAEQDQNFNIFNLEEGSGSDKVYYHIPLFENWEGATVNVKIHYIALPRKWLDQMFEEDATEINTFETMYNNEMEQSIIMVEESILLSSTSINELDFKKVKIYPNPSSDFIYIEVEENVQYIEISDSQGKLKKVISGNNEKLIKIKLPEANGKYYVKIQFIDKTIVTKTVIKLKT